ncbi:MAG: Crp/Fnr family transcriptional regulator [Bacteroidales bacterium]|nr:Crp/Fnr family transcriptional regulator [Bacteroidales bacterium]
MQNTNIFSKIESKITSLSNGEKKIITENIIELKYKKGENICKQGAFSSFVVFINSGFVKRYIEHKDKNLILSISHAGDFIGLSTLFHSKTFMYSATSIEDCHISSINKEIFIQLINKNAKFAGEILSILNSHTSLYFERFISLTQKQLHGRIADAILHLYKDVYKNEKFNFSLSRRDFAEFTGMSTESAIRILKEFHNDRIINLEGKTIEITSMELLEKLSELG